MPTTLQRVENERMKVLRRAASLQAAVEEYDEAVTEMRKEAEASAKSIRLNKKVQAKLLGISRSHLYRAGLDGCRNYAELYRKVNRLRPDLLETLEMNFDDHLKRIKTK